jgi:hypothetical protein
MLQWRDHWMPKTARMINVKKTPNILCVGANTATLSFLVSRISGHQDIRVQNIRIPEYQVLK